MSIGCPLCGATIADDGRVLVDIGGGLVVANGHVAQLTKQEWALFEALWFERPRMFTREQLAKGLYGLLPDADEPEIKIIDVFVCKLRAKLRPLQLQISTVWGKGYRIVPPGVQHPDHAAAMAAAGSTLQEAAQG